MLREFVKTSGFDLSAAEKYRRTVVLHKSNSGDAEGDVHIRELAVENLRWYPQAQDFLARRIEQETSPTVLMRLMRPSRGGEEYKRRVSQRVVEFLGHDDPEVRLEALSFIAWNSNRAPMWQFPFGQAAFHRVVQLTRSTSESEQIAATFALRELYQLHSETARTILLFIRSSSNP